jgi:hypothetical protein
MPREIPYPIPGEILLEEFLKPMGITQYRLAKLSIPAYACLASSVPATVSGSACRPITIQRKPKTPSLMCCRAFIVSSLLMFSPGA